MCPVFVGVTVRQSAEKRHLMTSLTFTSSVVVRCMLLLRSMVCMTSSISVVTERSVLMLRSMEPVTLLFMSQECRARSASVVMAFLFLISWVLGVRGHIRLMNIQEST